jgi:hypothetical protein
MHALPLMNIQPLYHSCRFDTKLWRKIVDAYPQYAHQLGKFYLFQFLSAHHHSSLCVLCGLNNVIPCPPFYCRIWADRQHLRPCDSRVRLRACQRSGRLQRRAQARVTDAHSGVCVPLARRRGGALLLPAHPGCGDRRALLAAAEVPHP